MGMQEQIATELRRRAALLPDVIAGWKKQTDQNTAKMGIHQSQIRAVGEMFDEFQARQTKLAEKLDPATAGAMQPEDFRRIRQEFEQELTGSHSIMAAFRYIFAQRHDSAETKEMLDSADLIAADCYLPCIKLANRWLGRPAGDFREPPLVYLNAKLSPAAITRRHYFGLVGLDLYGSLEQQLPISIVSLSFHDVAAVWTFCSLYHEVGHLVDQDIGLLEDFKTALKGSLAASANSEIWVDWWLAEMIADAFGVLLGGAGFAYALMSMLVKAETLVTGPTTDVHPSPYVRMFVISELLKQIGVEPLSTVAKDIEEAWKGAYGEPSAKWKPFVDECPQVADVLLNTQLASLGGAHTLLDFVSHPDAVENAADKQHDHKRALALERYLRSSGPRPDENKFPRRLVPAAAQLAVRNVTKNHSQAYADIQTRTLAFLAKLPHKEFLAAAPEASAKHREYVKSVIGKFDFSQLDIEG